jgi:hypothetical protein
MMEAQTTNLPWVALFFHQQNAAAALSLLIQLSACGKYAMGSLTRLADQSLLVKVVMLTACLWHAD